MSSRTRTTRQEANPLQLAPTPANLGGLPADLAAAIVERLDQIAELLRRLATPPTQPTAAGTAVSEYLDAGQVAELLGCSIRSVRTWGIDGTLPKPVRTGRSVRWKRSDIEKHIAHTGGRKK